MRVFKVNSLKEFKDLNLTQRSEDVVYEKMDYVREIMNDVKERGDEALGEYTQKFDKVRIDKEKLKVTQEETDEAFRTVSKEFVEAIKYAAGNVEKYHRLQLPKGYDIEVEDGITLGRRWVPLETVGLYIPGGKAPYVTACYMLGVPAMVAGCKRVIACAPPNPETGKINPYVLVSASLSGITSIYKVGGAQAISAMAYGTQSIPKVDKIFGPGNVYVTASKLLAYGKVDIDAPAGPSEALIIADDSINEKFVASDIISQAEHDVNSAAVFLTTSEEYAIRVREEVMLQTEKLDRKETIYQSLGNYGAIVVCSKLDLCIDIANDYAPEHIQVMTRNSQVDASRVINSGSVCIGQYSPIAMGDYISGVNNVIPTGGAAKYFSPVHVEGYMKCFETQRITKKGLEKVKNNLKTICDIEGFGAHYNSVDIRTRGGG